MRRQSTAYKLYASGGDFIRHIPLKEAHNRATSDIRILCRYCLRSSEKSRCLLNARGHEMVAQLKPSTSHENKLSGSKATITRGEMERYGLQQLFRRLDASESISSMVTAEDKVNAWPSVYNDKTVGICAGRAVNVTKMDLIPAH